MYEKCQLPPDWNAYDQACEDQQMSIEPAQFFGCTPYGNAAAIEEMQATFAASPTTTGEEAMSAGSAGSSARPGLSWAQIVADEETCRAKDEKADDFWRKEAVDTVHNPPKPSALPLKVLKWLLHPSVAC